jgi:catechol 2,3-dioxygenase-like lactoylglutathione lyase family enzyme
MFSLSTCKVATSVAVSDIGRAREFYEGVLGLTVRTDTGDNVAYTCADDSIFDIFVSPHAGTADSTVAGFGVEDIDLAVHELTKQGVTFERYTEGPIITDDRGVASFEGGNKVAYFKDPDGNILSIAYGPPQRSEPLDGAHVATRLPAQDLDRARAWYRDKLGLEPTEEREGGLWYSFGATAFALFTSQGRPSGAHTQMGIEVPDIEAAAAELSARGVQFIDVDAPGLETKDGIADIAGNYPSKGKGERGAWFHDSEGNLIGLGQPVR